MTNTDEHDFAVVGGGTGAGNDCNLNNPKGDYAHINSLQVVDGDVISSFRHCDQVLRIDRSGGTGAVKWKLGGAAPPEGSATEHLEVVGDPAGEFCSRHHATVTDSGSIVLFDNGPVTVTERRWRRFRRRSPWTTRLRATRTSTRVQPPSS